MSEQERAKARAEGSLANFLADMYSKLDKEGRSEEYKRKFWQALHEEMINHTLDGILD